MADPNLKAAQRLDPSIVAIIRKASNVVVYPFDERNDSWLDPTHRGPIFLCSTHHENSYRLVVFNSFSADNLIMTVNHDSEAQTEDDAKFLIMRDQADLVSGLWFPDEQECGQMTAAINTLVSQLAASQAIVPVNAFGGDAAQTQASGHHHVRSQSSVTTPVAPRRRQVQRLDPMGETLQRLVKDQLAKSPTCQPLSSQAFASVLLRIIASKNLQGQLHAQYQQLFEAARPEL
eukprot:m.135999 g.135999  ORF g.135999 m.135999 type:complete len:233 (+) comp16016_c0_seq6:105-803(+)